ncbi:rod shape-determining protein MreD [Haloimpatiens lingqiaonensis]|uniref:rod shape-determining protein MreD n=1 Tax=Haloimpatiens lingqiaonensis TaxID=1380675 RepID=UPI0010FD4CCE|nr:rod shape-determining protein MreD [Haloimpatiens lingqiaonensis]
MKRIITVFVLSITFLILDNTVIPFINIKEFYPSLLFIFAISYSIAEDENSAIQIGILSGVLQDIYFQGFFGINCFVNMILCFLASQIGKVIFKEKKLIPILTIFAASILKGVLIYSFSYVLKFYMEPAKIIFTSIYNMLIGIFVYAYVYKLSTKEYMKKDWKF